MRFARQEASDRARARYGRREARLHTGRDTELLHDYVARADEAAFGELVAWHGAFVQRACRRLLKDEHDAEDTCQAVFLVLARKAHRLRGGDLSAWLHRVAQLSAAKAVRNHLRARGYTQAGPISD